MIKLKMYAVRNGEGKYWNFGTHNTVSINVIPSREFILPDISSVITTFDKNNANDIAENFGGHVVTFVEEPEKVVLSKEEAEIVECARNEIHPASYIHQHCCDGDDEDRLIKAYVNGWTIEKPKRYVLPMPGTNYHNYQMHGSAQYYAVKITGSWRPDGIALGTDDAIKHGYTVTQSDIDAAPAWVKAIKPVEVTDDEV